MQEWAALVVTIIISVTATTGFWQLIQRRMDKKDDSAEMLLGLGHDRIIYLGLCYIERGSITQAEYENIEDYLYKPYMKLSGNGSAMKIMEEVRKLPIKKDRKSVV